MTAGSPERLHAHLRRLVGERHPLSSPERLTQAETYLAETFHTIGLSVTRHEFSALGGTYRNVVATLSSTRKPAEPALLIGAHFDTVEGSPGADDNASACAVLLEVARRLSGSAGDRPVHFVAFNLEEEDLLGSQAYAAHLKATGQDILGAIVLECVGYASRTEGSQRRPAGVPVPVPTVGDFLAVIGNDQARPLVEAMLAARTSVPELPLVPLLVPGCGETLPDTRRSDHAAFWDCGLPAVMLTDTANFRNPHYHRATDTLETLDLEFMAKVAGAVTKAAQALCGARE